ncbi:hypothetical protein BD779DRAFT_1475141 [Infundibulicybe gibba]|nr:hypothetical protein BD779DRAFT_1475141 [Infundibulicybe gibba]
MLRSATRKFSFPFGISLWVPMDTIVVVLAVNPLVNDAHAVVHVVDLYLDEKYKKYMFAFRGWSSQLVQSGDSASAELLHSYIHEVVHAYIPDGLGYPAKYNISGLNPHFTGLRYNTADSDIPQGDGLPLNANVCGRIWAGFNTHLNVHTNYHLITPTPPHARTEPQTTVAKILEVAKLPQQAVVGFMYFIGPLAVLHMLEASLIDIPSAVRESQEAVRYLG